MKIKIAVCYHKVNPIFENEILLPIHGGRAISRVKLNIQGDDTGDNISRYNNEINEMTVMYWACKNLNHYDCIGLCHYSKFFLIDDKRDYFQNEYYLTSEEFKKMSYRDIYLQKYFSEFDVILPKTKFFTTSIENRFSNLLDKRNLIYVNQVIEELCPEYMEVWKKYKRENNTTPYNMLIAKVDIINTFCEWYMKIFKRLFELKDDKNNSLGKPRELGFILELLTPLFFMQHKEYRIKRLPVAVMYPVRENKSNFRYCLSYLKTELIYFLHI